jgi:hypothetical protein
VISVIRCLDQHCGDEIDESKFDGVVTFNHTISIAHKIFGLTAMESVGWITGGLSFFDSVFGFILLQSFFFLSVFGSIILFRKK